jgi:hypothetical protein
VLVRQVARELLAMRSQGEVAEVKAAKGTRKSSG